MSNKRVTIQLDQNDVPSFLACLGLGTLMAIQKGQIPAEAATWTMGAPRVWEPLIEHSLVPKEIIDVFEQGDELAALEELSPDLYQEELSLLISQLQKTIGQVSNPSWRLRWNLHENESILPSPSVKPNGYEENRHIQQIAA